MSPRTKPLTGAALRQAIREEIERQMEEGREDGVSGKVHANRRATTAGRVMNASTGLSGSGARSPSREAHVPVIVDLAPSSLPSFPCPFCPESFAYQVELLAHDLAVHQVRSDGLRRSGDERIARAEAKLKAKRGKA